MTGVRIVAIEGGPYRIEGAAELRDQDGNPIAGDGDSVLLCGCGRSDDKPFCDGGCARAGPLSRSSPR